MKPYRIVALVLLVGLSLGVGVWLGSRRAAAPVRAAGAPGTARWQCSMHPQIVSDKPGVCPICQMELERVDDEAGGRGRIVFYRHPMRPEVTSPTPAKDEMGMDYVPVYEEDLHGEGGIPGRAGFTLSAERQQLIGVRTDTVERRRLVVPIRAVGKVAYDPGLYQAIVEYREALRARGMLRGADLSEAREGADALVRAAALKLRQQGISEAQVRDVTPDGRDPVSLLLPGKEVWIYAEVYEYEVELVRPGEEMVVTVPSLPGRTFRAAVVAVDPIVNATTRTARVRARVSTPDAALRPETFVNVALQVPLGDEVAVPESAVLDGGGQRIVFVVQGEGRFVPRAVELGREAEGYYEVLDGLAPGERVVTSANFLIDSESRFRSAVAAFGK